jgi:hypothetical protein
MSEKRKRRSGACIWWAIGIVLILVVSVAGDLIGLKEARRAIFVPAGDVAYGFRSFDGWLSWEQYAAADFDPDYVVWTVPSRLVIAAELGSLVFIAWRKRRFASL